MRLQDLSLPMLKQQRTVRARNASTLVEVYIKKVTLIMLLKLSHNRSRLINALISIQLIRRLMSN
jgi:hypothetical protein